MRMPEADDSHTRCCVVDFVNDAVNTEGQQIASFGILRIIQKTPAASTNQITKFGDGGSMEVSKVFLAAPSVTASLPVCFDLIEIGFRTRGKDYAD